MQGPKWPLFTLIWTICGRWMCWDRLCTKVELPVQRRLCPIFVRDVGSLGIHERFRGLTGSQRTPGIWGGTAHAMATMKTSNHIPYK